MQSLMLLLFFAAFADDFLLVLDGAFDDDVDEFELPE
jgi:hypothetical protein